MQKLVPTLLILFWTLAPAWAQPLIEEENRFYSQEAPNGMVVAGEERATAVGRAILEEGGNAVDAAVATAYALAVTLPRAGNLGGGGFMLIRSPLGQVYALDFRETAPGAASHDMYLEPDGQVNREKKTVGALASGTPGTVAGLQAALERFGTMSTDRVVEPAVKYAEEGIVVGPWLSRGLASVKDKMEQFPASWAIFFPNGETPKVSQRLFQKDLGLTLRRIAATGGRDFYDGETAKLLAQAVQEAGGLITEEDLRNYRPVWRDPVSGTFRRYTVYSMPPPSSGGIHLIQMLNMIEHDEFKVDSHNSAADLHLLAEAMRSAYADRSKWLGDPDFADVPQEWLISEEYAQKLRRAIPSDRARKSEEVSPGKPSAYESPQTTHLCTVDKDGWAVSLTYTLNFSYGSGLVAEGTGVLLNNEMDDFAAAPGKANSFGLIGGEANSIQPGKRPLSSMTPTIVTKDGELVAVLGAPGGSRIITAVFQALLNNIGYGFNAQSSVSLPRIHHQWYPDKLFYEQGISLDTRRKLEAMGHTLDRIYAVGHVLYILARPDGQLEAGADPRRPASALGY